MALKFYYDLMSQPCRALFIFFKQTKIPYVDCQIALRKAEHLSDDFAKINRFRKVPAIDHDGFKLAESVAIFRYLIREFKDNVKDHWYPSDSKKMARVDEFLAWQHLNLRFYGTSYARVKIFEPLITRRPVDNEKLKYYAENLEVTLQSMEQLFFGENQQFICGSQISIADLIGACELEQPRAVGFDVYNGRPNLQKWMNNVREYLNPDYDEAHKYIYRISKNAVFELVTGFVILDLVSVIEILDSYYSPLCN